MRSAEPGIAGYIAQWRPSSLSPPAAAFARGVAGQAAPERKERAKNLLRAAGKLAGFGIGLGLDAVPEVLLHPSVAERFTRCAPGLSGVARRTLRTNLRFIGRRVVPQLYPADMPLPREHAKEPYSAAEIAGYLALADAQPTPQRRIRAAGLVCLGAGAGLIRAGLRAVRGTDVACRSGGVIVAVRGARLRAGACQIFCVSWGSCRPSVTLLWVVSSVRVRRGRGRRMRQRMHSWLLSSRKFRCRAVLFRGSARCRRYAAR